MENNVSDYQQYKNTKEFELMISLLRNEINELQISQLINNLDWDVFLDLIIHHRVYPIIYKNTQKLNENLIPVKYASRLQYLYFQNTLKMLKLSSEMIRLNNELIARNIRCIVLKGPALAMKIYGNYSDRTSKDLDILVSPEDFDSAHMVMINNGYVNEEEINVLKGRKKWNEHHVVYHHPDLKVQIEVHFRLSFDIKNNKPSFNELWNRSEQTIHQGNLIHILGREDLFVYLAHHGARHVFFRLRWLHDLDQFMRLYPLSEDVIKKIIYYECAKSVELCCTLLKHFFGTPIQKPMNLVSDNKDSKKLKLIALKFITEPISFESLSPYHMGYYKSYQLLLKQGMHKGVYLISLLYPNNRDIDTLKLPKYLQFLYFPMRPFLWMWRVIKRTISQA
ncbi:nucleotidyltransferase family protein [Neobacillus mesonae]|nr:nucleotidyltransferase family protein [Neobacillus mesonae]